MSIIYLIFSIGILLGAIFFLFKMISNYYLKVPPNKVAIIYGKKNKTKDGIAGYEMLTGGSRFIIPILESVDFLDLSVFSMEIDVNNVPNNDGVLVSVKGNVNVKILSDDTSLPAACERFLGKTQDEIKTIAHRSLEGHLRAIIGRLTIEEIVSDRATFNQKVLEEAGEDLRKLGLGVDFLTVQEISDNDHYLEVLGQKKIAEVKKDAAVGKAEAERETTMQTTGAIMEGKKRAAENDAKVAEAEKERDVKRARYHAETEKEEAISEQARPLASANAQKEVVTQQLEVERIRAEQEAKVALAEAEKKKNELLSSVVNPADAQKQADILNAEASASVAIKVAEGEKQKRELEAQGKAAAILAEGKAEAEVIRLKLEAEAEGISKKADAYKKMDEVGRQLQVIEKLGEVGPELLEGVSKIVGEAAKPLGNVGEIKILDMGGNSNGKGGAVGNFGSLVPNMLLQMNEAMKSAGFDISGLLGKASIKETGGSILDPEIANALSKATPEQISMLKSFLENNKENSKD